MYVYVYMYRIWITKDMVYDANSMVHLVLKVGVGLA